MAPLVEGVSAGGPAAPAGICAARVDVAGVETVEPAWGSVLVSAPPEVGPIDPAHLARWLERRSRTGGLPEFPYGEEIVALAGPCTGDVIRLAKSVFELAARGGPRPALVATAFDAIALGELAPEFNARWAECSIGQRSVLRALAAGKAPTAADTLRAYGIKSASTAQGAVEALTDRYLIVRSPGGLLFDSPFFRRWVVFNGA